MTEKEKQYQEEYRKIHSNVPIVRSVHKRLKLYSVKIEKSLSMTITDILTDFLDKAGE